MHPPQPQQLVQISPKKRPRPTGAIDLTIEAAASAPIEPTIERPGEPAETPELVRRVLLSLDWRGVLDKSFADSHLFLTRLAQQSVEEAAGVEIILNCTSYSGVDRARRTEQELRNQFSEYPIGFVRASHPTGPYGKGRVISQLLDQLGCSSALHIDDRADVCIDVRFC